MEAAARTTSWRTPQSDGANYGCALGHVSCSTTDMVQNYMDYSTTARTCSPPAKLRGCRPCSPEAVPEPAC